MPTITDASDVGAAIRAARRARGMTQAELAAHAGVGRQWLVALERGHPRAELGKVLTVLQTLELTTATARHRTTAPQVTLGTSQAERTWLTAGDAAEAIRAELTHGDTDFALRILGRSLADLRSLSGLGDIAGQAAFLAEPPSTGDHRWDTLLATAVGHVCGQLGIPAPAWTHVLPLDVWWFPVFDPVLAARTMQRTPPAFAARGIWLDARALEVM